jgi:hypothetical protein
VDLLKIAEHRSTAEFYSCITSHHLLPLITRPTRITCNSSTLIDNIFTNTWPRLTKSSILATDISDHLPILAQFSYGPLSCSKPSVGTHRLITGPKKTAFNEALALIDWSPVLEACANQNANEAYDLFQSKYMESYNEFFPLTLNNCGRNSTPKKTLDVKGSSQIL